MFFYAININLVNSQWLLDRTSVPFPGILGQRDEHKVRVCTCEFAVFVKLFLLLRLMFGNEG